ncbi:MAG: hypothetical protein LBJ81_02550 [Puniceicoccales bacterium]|jgi:hypothetical protein|nr:hypothetical protein [Puniceicoccales bacterium]
MESLALKKISRNDIFIDNVFYGRRIGFALQCDGRPLEVEIRRHETQFSTEIGLTIGRYPCALLLESLPPLTIFSQQFDDIDLQSLPEDIRLLALQVATEALQRHFSTALKTTVTVDSVGATAAKTPQNGIDFTLASEQNHLAAGTLVAPKEVLALLAKKIPHAPNLRNLKNLEMAYRVCVGSTRLSSEDYRNLAEEDIVFLDQYELAKSKKVGIVGFDGLRICGSFSETGVIVEQIAQ